MRLTLVMVVAWLGSVGGWLRARLLTVWWEPSALDRQQCWCCWWCVSFWKCEYVTRACTAACPSSHTSGTGLWRTNVLGAGAVRLLQVLLLLQVHRSAGGCLCMCVDWLAISIWMTKVW